MENEKKFKTKTGYCHILSDKIILTRDGIIGNISQISYGNNIIRAFVIYGLISIFGIYKSYEWYSKGNIYLSIFFGVIALIFILVIFKSLNNSGVPIIERNQIKEIKLKKGINGLTRSRFEVYFYEKNGKLKKRLIMLPGSMTGGQEETEKAIKIMTKEKLLV